MLLLFFFVYLFMAVHLTIGALGFYGAKHDPWPRDLVVTVIVLAWTLPVSLPLLALIGLGMVVEDTWRGLRRAGHGGRG